MNRLLLAAACLAAVLALTGIALAWDGSTPPNDPNYAPAESDPVTKCINDEEWFLYSFMPKCTPAAKDPENAAGMSIDQAWAKFTIGRPDVRIAYIEGGPNWHWQQARQELANRTYLNTGELPKPEHADGSACGSYDCNGDGQVSAADYAADPRIHKPYINGDLTPEDLIVAFSNGRDDDGNGYVDDISGWNFSRFNNDPATSDSAYHHSDNQMQRAAAETDDGIADAGICPRCQLIPIKAGDEALDRTDRIAQSIYFAVDSGASVVVVLTAELGYSNATKAALDYAWKKGVVTVGASNDFDSADHQEGMFWPRMWPGNGIVADQSGAEGSGAHTDHLTQSFRERSNYTSFGPHDLFSMPSEGGTTSESQPTQGAVAALMASWGRTAADRHLISAPLDAGEIKNVLMETASNIDDPSLGWPGKPGATFNIQYGYGRPNVAKAMQAVADNRIPPVPDIQSPDWYALFDPTHDRSVPITGDIEARRARSFDYVVQYGLGPDPTESEFRTIAAGHVNGQSKTGTLGTLDLSQIPQSFWQKAFANTTDLSSIEQYDVTIRVRATDDRGNTGEDRRAVAVFHDPSIRPGFPLRLGQSQESQPLLADLNGDGKLDMIFGDANGVIHAIDWRGHSLPGWPAHTDQLDLGLANTPAGRAHAVPLAREPVISPAAVGDLDGDGMLEVVVTSTTGTVYVFEPDGKRRPGFPQTVSAEARSLAVPPPDEAYGRPASMGALAAPVLAPLPGSSSKLSILQSAFDRRVYAFDGSGHAVPGWPVTVTIPDDKIPGGYTKVDDAKVVATPTLADLNGDGVPEVVVKSQVSAFSNDPSGLGVGSRFFDQAIWAGGTRHPGGPFVPGWPATLQGTLDAYGTAQDFITEGGDSASAADVNGDGRDEVIQPLVLGFPEVINGDGSISGAGPPQPTMSAGNAAAIGALEQQLQGGAQSGSATQSVPTLDLAVTPVGFTTSGAYARFGGKLSWLSAGSDLSTLAALLHPGQAQRITNFMRAYDASNGQMLPGFPAPMMGLPFLTAPAVADLNGDGTPDVVNGEDSNNVQAFDDSGHPIQGFPKFTGGWTVWTPGVGDIDDDGRNEVAVTTREGYVFVWGTSGHAATNEAYGWHQDDWHTGRYGTDTRPPIEPQALRRAGRNRACWTAPGDDWDQGKAASYDLRAFARGAHARRTRRHHHHRSRRARASRSRRAAAPTAGTFTRGRRLAAPRPAGAGARQCASVPSGATYVGLRAVDDAGLVSRPAFLDLQPRHVRKRRRHHRHR